MSALPTRALSCWQPFAWLLAHGHKPIENRPPGFSHKSFLGDFWIHASAREIDEATWQLAVELCHRYAPGIGTAMTIAQNQAELHLGAIIGRATVTGIIPPRGMGGILESAAASVPWHFPDQYGFTLEHARALTKPVPCRGYQGFFTVRPEVLEALRVAA